MSPTSTCQFPRWFASAYGCRTLRHKSGAKWQEFRSRPGVTGSRLVIAEDHYAAELLDAAGISARHIAAAARQLVAR